MHVRLQLSSFSAVCLFALLGCQTATPEPVSPVPASTPAASPTGVAPIDKNLPRPDVIAVSPPLPGFQRGINLGNGLDAPSEGEWGRRITEKDFQLVASAGFDHVRLPVRFTTLERSDPKPPYTIKPEFFARVDWALDQARTNKLSIILDVHHFEEIHKDPRANQERLYALWRQIATHYANRPPEVAFEILNEPNGKLESPILNEMTRDVLKIIRESNPTRLVFANCYFWANAERLAELELPADDANVVAEFHMYQPILFTHQGAPWMEPWSQTTGLVFPAPPSKPATPVPAASKEGWVKAWFDGYNYAPAATNPGGVRTVFEHFDHAARYVKKTGKRVYLGEFGAIDVADAQSRENYTWLVRTESERRGIGWAYWDDGGKFKVLDAPNGKWNEGLRRALVDR
jgi:endoglucanase